MHTPQIDVKLLHISGRTHFCRVLPPVPQCPEETTWHPTYQTIHLIAVDDTRGMIDYARTREDHM